MRDIDASGSGCGAGLRGIAPLPAPVPNPVPSWIGESAGHKGRWCMAPLRHMMVTIRPRRGVTTDEVARSRPGRSALRSEPCTNATRTRLPDSFLLILPRLRLPLLKSPTPFLFLGLGRRNGQSKGGVKGIQVARVQEPRGVVQGGGLEQILWGFGSLVNLNQLGA